MAQFCSVSRTWGSEIVYAQPTKMADPVEKPGKGTLTPNDDSAKLSGCTEPSHLAGYVEYEIQLCHQFC